MSLQIFQVDAFASEPFRGNPAAVVPLESWLPAETMLKIAAENNLAETAFFVKNGDGYDLRWFTPTVEIDLCGHATLASAYVLYELLGETVDVLKFQTKSGQLTVEKKADLLVLDFPSRPAKPCETPDGLLEAIGKAPKEILRSRDYLMVYESEEEVREIKPNFAALLNIPTHAVIVTAKGSDCDFVSRFFAPEVGVFEDPVTGSAHCTLIPYWAGKLGKTEFFARQISARGGELFCELHGDRVKIGGRAALYMRGEIFVGESLAEAVAN
ncbi:MAG TPA: PhzF family phenazine biosynthesis protein [Pyrinomonadaceae bacterium]|jgi:PhzF family phenazine biosynthesis protein|nr:PhzF family phenazine biosynthesis protein [Pyrinomonadaceae bacterium]